MQKIAPALVVFTLLLTSACTIAPEKAKPNWNQATSAEQYERLFWNSVKARNWREVEAHLSSTILAEGSEIVLDKQQLLQHLKQIDLTDYSMGDIRTEVNGPDLAITYTMRIHGTINGKPFPDRPLRMLTVWQQVEKGNNLMIVHTTIEEPEMSGAS